MEFGHGESGGLGSFVSMRLVVTINLFLEYGPLILVTGRLSLVIVVCLPYFLFCSFRNRAGASRSPLP